MTLGARTPDVMALCASRGLLVRSAFLATDLRNELRFAATRSHGLGGSVGCCDVVVRFSEPVRVREHTDDREPTLR